MIEETTNPKSEPTLPPTVDIEGEVEDVEFKSSPEAQAAADEAIAAIEDRSFSGRNASLGKMINCQICRRRHRRSDAAFREHYDEQGNKTVTLEVLISDCKQQFKQMWVDEDLETGELLIQYATVPLPGQKRKTKKHKNRHPNKTGLQIVEITRQLFPFVNKERFTEDSSRMLEARRLAENTLRNRRELESKRIRQQQRDSRRINREK